MMLAKDIVKGATVKYQSSPFKAPQVGTISEVVKDGAGLVKVVVTFSSSPLNSITWRTTSTSVHMDRIEWLEIVESTTPTICKCGIDSRNCEYHRP